jgi:hypothetical protein
MVAICSLIAFSSIVLCQVVNPEQVVSPEQVVRRIVESGISEGHDQKIIGRMGDAAAVALTKILGGRSLSSSDVENVLAVLTSAFSDPQMVQDLSDREPKTALFILQYLNSSASDLQLKARIAKTRSYVLERYERYGKNSSGSQ